MQTWVTLAFWKMQFLVERQFVSFAHVTPSRELVFDTRLHVLEPAAMAWPMRARREGNDGDSVAHFSAVARE